MAFRPPDILGPPVFDLTLSNGNIHRLEPVTYGRNGRGVVLLECREYISPENPVGSHSGPTYHAPGPDGRPWTLGLTKGLRMEHLEAILEDPERAVGILRAAQRANEDRRVDGFGRPIDLPGGGS